MDTFETGDQAWQTPLAISIICASTLLTLVWFYGSLSASHHEAPVAYSVPVPEQCKPGWKGDILEEPRIKVRYNRTPRTGADTSARLLGLVRFNAIVQQMGDF